MSLFDRTIIKTSSDEIVNGYRLLDDNNINIIKEKHFNMLLPYFHYGDSDVMEERFESWLDEHLGAEWGRVDEDGNAFVGEYWDQSIPNRFILTFQKNKELLQKLPHNRIIMAQLLEEIQATFANPFSIRMLNFWCVWLERKHETMKKAKARIRNILKRGY